MKLIPGRLYKFRYHSLCPTFWPVGKNKLKAEDARVFVDGECLMFLGADQEMGRYGHGRKWFQGSFLAPNGIVYLATVTNPDEFVILK